VSYDHWKASMPSTDSEGCPECSGPVIADRYSVECEECGYYRESLPED